VLVKKMKATVALFASVVINVAVSLSPHGGLSTDQSIFLRIINGQCGAKAGDNGSGHYRHCYTFTAKLGDLPNCLMPRVLASIKARDATPKTEVIPNFDELPNPQ